MKKFILAAVSVVVLNSAASAADFGVIAHSAPMAYAPQTDWTGFYAGVFAGVGGGPTALNFSDPGGLAPLSFSGNAFGGLTGLQVGVDYQIDQFVVGAAADIAATNIAVNTSFGAGGGPGAITYKTSLDYLGTLRARAGFLATDKLLAYLHGGIAYGRSSPSLAVGGGVAPTLGQVNRWGYTIGAGLEYAITDSLSLQTEYAYTDLGNPGVAISGGAILPPGAAANENFQFHTVKAGLNFRF